MKSATTIRPFARLLFRSLAALVLLSALSAFLPLASAQTHTIHGNTPGFIQKAQDLGAVDPSSVISVTAWLKLHNEGKLDQLVESQKQKGSANYQKWITQAQFNASFSPTAQEVKAVQNFLSAHGLTTLTVAENNFYVKVQGTVGAIQKTFNVQIDSYSLKGATYRSNKADPKVDGTAGGLIAAVTGLDDYGFQPMVVRPSGPDGKSVPSIPLNVSSNGAFFESQCFRAPETQTFTGGGNTATYTGNRYGADITNNTLGHLPPCGYQPSEMQTAYDMTPLYGAGLDGTGQTIVITDAFGSATIRTDAEAFSQIYGLPDLTPSNFQVLRAPGAVHNPGVPHFGGSATRFPIAGKASKASEIPLSTSATTASSRPQQSKEST